MAANVADRAVIGFPRDYDPGNLGEQWIYQLTDGGVKTHKPAGVSNGKSIEHFLVGTVDRLEVVCEATAGGWNVPKRFRELQECLRGDALESYKKLVRNNYVSTQIQWTRQTRITKNLYIRLIPTNLGDHPYP